MRLVLSLALAVLLTGCGAKPEDNPPTITVSGVAGNQLSLLNSDGSAAPTHILDGSQFSVRWNSVNVSDTAAYPHYSVAFFLNGDAKNAPSTTRFDSANSFLCGPTVPECDQTGGQIDITAELDTATNTVLWSWFYADGSFVTDSTAAGTSYSVIGTKFCLVDTAGNITDYCSEYGINGLPYADWDVYVLKLDSLPVVPVTN